MPKLGINIDHVATLRQARRECEPDPIEAARICVAAGADSIVAHLREDRRHINDDDIRKLRKVIKIRFNLEMSINREIVKIACRIKPSQATLVPERRQEITTEGGLDVVGQFAKIKNVVGTLERNGIAASLFIDPVRVQIQRAAETGARIIELHTGQYARARTKSVSAQELKRLKECARFAKILGLTVNVGHGLNYYNTHAVARIQGIHELNIGHSIISRAVFVGIKKAVKEMLRLAR